MAVITHGKAMVTAVRNVFVLIIPSVVACPVLWVRLYLYVNIIIHLACTTLIQLFYIILMLYDYSIFQFVSLFCLQLGRIYFYDRRKSGILVKSCPAFWVNIWVWISTRPPAWKRTWPKLSAMCTNKTKLDIVLTTLVCYFSEKRVITFPVLPIIEILYTKYSITLQFYLEAAV